MNGKGKVVKIKITPENESAWYDYIKLKDEFHKTLLGTSETKSEESG